MNSEDIRVVQFIHEHQQQVGAIMRKVINKLIHRALTHDASKFTTQELEDNLKALPDKWRLETEGHDYFSPPMDAHRETFASVIARHRKNNRHHPEYHGNRVEPMNLIDLIEMICDWYVACKTSGGDIYESISNNSDKYHISDQLRQILTNTACKLEDING